ncbi:MAG: hypothetical protein HY955_00670 [Deltaproteobacteria bacterium]|nr:hypothetical protein [Deltaproteobacteria bacterium]
MKKTQSGLTRSVPAAFLSAKIFFPATAALFLLLVIMPGPSSSEEGRAAESPHDFSRKEFCSVCHKAEPPLLNLDPVTTCTKCHPGNVGNHPVTRHPIGKMPRIRVPASLPLTDDGEMVCYTCHEPHNKSRHGKMLRVDFTKLCASCHAGY